MEYLVLERNIFFSSQIFYRYSSFVFENLTFMAPFIFIWHNKVTRNGKANIQRYVCVCEKCLEYILVCVICIRIYMRPSNKYKNYKFMNIWLLFWNYAAIKKWLNAEVLNFIKYFPFEQMIQYVVFHCFAIMFVLNAHAHLKISEN